MIANLRLYLRQQIGQKDGKLREQMWPEEAQIDGSWMQNDPRVPWLMEILRKELKHKKVLLIARSGPVVESLESALRLHAGIRTAMFHEGMSLLERDQAAAYFAEESYGAQILLCSEIGSEGRNFQFASDLILFDLPANPDVFRTTYWSFRPYWSRKPYPDSCTLLNGHRSRAYVPLV